MPPATSGPISEDVALTSLTADLKAVYKNWDTLRGAAFALSWQQFDLMDLPPRLIPTTMVVDIKDDMKQNTYRFWGSGLTNIHGREMTGKCPYDLQPPSLGERLLAEHMDTIQRRSATARRMSFVTARGSLHHQELLRLPLSDDGDVIQQLVVVVDYPAEILEDLYHGDQVYADIVPKNDED